MLDPVVIGPHRLLAGDVCADDLARLLGGERAQVVYCDPPWGPRACTDFHRRAGRTAPAWPVFLREFVAAIAGAMAARHGIFIEMGTAWEGDLADALHAGGLAVRRAWTTRYGSPPRSARLLYAGRELPSGFNPTGLGGPELIRACLATGAYRGEIVLDPCCGRGMTARAAVGMGMGAQASRWPRMDFAFRGLELDPRRLEVTATWLRGRT